MGVLCCTLVHRHHTAGIHIPDPKVHASRVAEADANADAVALETIQHYAKRTMLENIFWLNKVSYIRSTGGHC